MPEVKALITDECGQNDRNREAARQEAETALRTAGIQAEVRLSAVSCTGRITVSCAAGEEKNIQDVLGRCKGIHDSFVEDPRDPTVETMMVIDEPPDGM